MSYDYRGPGVTKPHPKKGWVITGRPYDDAPVRPVGVSRPSTSSDRGGNHSSGPSLVQVFAGVVGLVFVLLGIGGFIPGVTSNTDELSLVGTDSMAELLGLFRVSIAHNVVHLLFGIGLLAAARASWSKIYLIGGGVAYAAVTAYGFAVDETSDANFLPVNEADNYLHVGVTAALVLLGVIGIAVQRSRSTSA